VLSITSSGGASESVVEPAYLNAPVGCRGREERYSKCGRHHFQGRRRSADYPFGGRLRLLSRLTATFRKKLTTSEHAKKRLATFQRGGHSDVRECAEGSLMTGRHRRPYEPLSALQSWSIKLLTPCVLPHPNQGARAVLRPRRPSFQSLGSQRLAFGYHILLSVRQGWRIRIPGGRRDASPRGSR
jgi:hypothetical protein